MPSSLMNSTFARASASVACTVVVSPWSAACSVTATSAPLFRSTACSALWARCVLPSFIFAMRESGSAGLFQSLFEVFFLRLRSSRANCSGVGFSMPPALASPVRYSTYFAPVSRRTIERMAAFASSVVASMPTVRPRTHPGAPSTPQPSRTPRDAFAAHLVAVCDAPQHVTFRHASRLSPGVDGDLHPSRHRNRAHAAVLPEEVHNAPAVVALLNVLQRKRRHFRSAQPAAQQDSLPQNSQTIPLRADSRHLALIG